MLRVLVREGRKVGMESVEGNQGFYLVASKVLRSGVCTKHYLEFLKGLKRLDIKSASLVN